MQVGMGHVGIRWWMAIGIKRLCRQIKKNYVQSKISQKSQKKCLRIKKVWERTLNYPELLVRLAGILLLHNECLSVVDLRVTIQNCVK